MQEYKREKSTLESRLKEVSKTVTNHEEHIRVLDAWLKQVYIQLSGFGGFIWLTL